MIFAPRDASVIEFAMQPHTNRGYGFLSMALGLDYWLVPQLSSHYNWKYTADEENAEAVADVLRHVLKTKGLGEMIRLPAKVCTRNSMFSSFCVMTSPTASAHAANDTGGY